MGYPELRVSVLVLRTSRSALYLPSFSFKVTVFIAFSKRPKISAKALAIMSRETQLISLTTTGLWGENGRHSVTDKDLQAISEQLFRLLSAVPRTLCCIGQCLAIAWSDGGYNIGQERDPELYANNQASRSFGLTCANNPLPDTNISKLTSRNVPISGKRRSEKRDTEWTVYI